MSNNTHSKDNDPVFEQAYYNQLLHNMGGTDYQAIYNPKEYQGVSQFVSKHIPEDSFKRIKLDRAISIYCDTNCILENRQLNLSQKYRTLLATVDQILKLLEAPRTMENRFTGVMYLFPDDVPGFEYWLRTDYLESNMEVVKEVRAHLIDKIKRVSHEERYLQKNQSIKFDQAELLAVVEELYLCLKKTQN